MSAGAQTPGTAVGDHTAPRTPRPAARWLTARLVDRIDALAGEVAADQRPATRPLLVGAGEGVVSERLRRRFGTCATLDLHADALRLPFPDGAFDLVVCVDVLERLRDPGAGLRELARVSSRHLLLPVPHEPFFRATDLLTGRSLRGAGTAPGRVQHWTGAGFQRFVSTVANVRAVASPYPWTVVWATEV